MPYLTTATVIFGALTILNLLLTVTVLRRLRDQGQHEEHPAPALPFAMQESGSPAPEVDATDVDGRPVSIPGDVRLVGFFSGSCRSCRDHVNPFLAYVEGMRDGDALAVVSGTAEDTEDLVTALGGAARVVQEPQRGPVTSGFDVSVFPSFFLLGPDGTIVASHTSIRLIPGQAAA
ncbi:TlpA family protein disulfide reductase [Actinomadura harenae]|uniref:Thioredoxin domain-containing protein n=1 Tax=Actinomadura harenae TaxID=2483351 RepID=A0A3M2LZY2_9ACTN|nr:hypothetical protein [Actinomadura harenae]RMI43019.1 hypothetical protein EBO15_17420 [Actinomadura harenae]